MKVITEADLRAKCCKPGDTLFLGAYDYLTDQAKKYAEETKLNLVRENDEQRPMPMGKKQECGYVSQEDGTRCKEKPEHMTHLRDNILVPKNSDRIRYRGMLDYAQAKTVETQVLAEKLGFKNVSDNLQSFLLLLRKLMSCDVLEAPLGDFELLGLCEKEIRLISHNPQKYVGIGHILPDRSCGELCVAVNVLRTIVRQTELSAMDAYSTGSGYAHEDAILALNRLSSAVYIIYCRLLAGYYGTE